MSPHRNREYRAPIWNLAPNGASTANFAVADDRQQSKVQATACQASFMPGSAARKWDGGVTRKMGSDPVMDE